MEESQKPAGGDPLPVQGPHWHRGPQPQFPPDFFPLRLVLQPGGCCVELARPDMVVGRHSEADIRLPLPDVSRRHCRFVFLDGGWQVFDLNSLNGLQINGQPVQSAILQDGDALRIGGFIFEVRLPSPRPAVGDEVLYRIAESLPPKSGEQTRKAS